MMDAMLERAGNAAAVLPREIPAPPIAGIPIVHVAPASVPVMTEIAPGWRGSRVVDAPLRIHHAFGDTTPVDCVPLVQAPPPLGTYYRDPAGHLAVRSTGRNAADADGPPQLLRTLRDGDEYSLCYERGDDPLRMQWGWQRTILMFALAARGRGLAVHATAFLLPGGGAVLCPGVSGAGKSTLARLLAEGAGEPVTVLSDDRVAVTAEPTGPRVWGMPWYSRARAAAPGDGPLAAVVHLRHGAAASLRAIPAAEAARRILRTLAFPFWSELLMDAAMRLADRMVTGAPQFEFTFAPRRDDARELVRALTSTTGA